MNKNKICKECIICLSLIIFMLISGFYVYHEKDCEYRSDSEHHILECDIE